MLLASIKFKVSNDMWTSYHLSGMFFFLFHFDTLHAFQKKIMYIYACDSLTLEGVPQIYSVIIISYKKIMVLINQK